MTPYQPDFPILNFDETGRFVIEDYKPPKGYKQSMTVYHSLEDAENELKNLKLQDRYSYHTVTSCLGTVWMDDDTYRIVYKVTVSNS